MANTEMPPEIDFDALAAEDEDHIKEFRIVWPDAVLIGIFAFLFFTVFLQFFTRYVLNDSVAWTEEAARYLLILLTFAGAIRCQFRGSHIALEFVDKYYGKRLSLVHIGALVLTLGLLLVLIFSAYELVQRTHFQKMVSLPFPKYYLYTGVMVLAGTHVLAVLAQIYWRIKDMKKS